MNLFYDLPVLLTPDWDLLTSHAQEWDRFWDSFNILVKGNEQLARIIHSSIYAIVSALPSRNTSLPAEGLFYGLSPTGLGRGGSRLDDYEGLQDYQRFPSNKIVKWIFPIRSPP